MSIITTINHIEITKGFLLTKFPNLSKNDTKVLIVEDETVLAIGMEYSLEEYGYIVSGIESSALEAINHVHNNPVDIVLMDIKLKSKMTGVEAARKIWEELKIPIVFLTSYSDDKTIQNAMDCEPYGYLLKPCRDEELKVAIETALKKHQLFNKNSTFDINNQIEKIIHCKEGYSYDKSKRILFHNANIVNLTGKEILLFDLLSDYPGQPVSFDRISDFIWDKEYTDIGKLRTLIYRIKTKLGVNLIENIFEHGYKLNTDD